MSDIDLIDFYRKIAAFLLQLRPSSRAMYQQILTDWVAFLGEKWGTQDGMLAYLQASKDDAARYKEYISRLPGIPERHSGNETEASPATVRKKIHAVRSSYRHMQAEGVAPLNPFYGIKTPNVDREKRPINMLPFNRVLDLVDSPGTVTLRGLRDRGILAALYGGGLRVSEVEKLKVRDLKQTDAGSYYLVLENTKGGKHGTVTIPDWAGERVASWRTRRLISRAGMDDWLFCGFASQGDQPKGTRISEGSILKWHRKYCAKIGLDPKQYSTHSGRVTSISKLRADGVDIREVQEFSRHASVDMVMRYDKRYLSKDQAAGKTLSYDKEVG